MERGHAMNTNARPARAVRAWLAAAATLALSACGDVEVGEGRVLACLDEHDDALGDSCEAALDALEE